jgi:hypothetical protein
MSSFCRERAELSAGLAERGSDRRGHHGTGACNGGCLMPLPVPKRSQYRPPARRALILTVIIGPDCPGGAQSYFNVIPDLAIVRAAAGGLR